MWWGALETLSSTENESIKTWLMCDFQFNHCFGYQPTLRKNSHTEMLKEIELHWPTKLK